MPRAMLAGAIVIAAGVAGYLAYCYGTGHGTGAAQPVP
jgi:hypothetical protein